MEQSNRYWSTTYHHKYPWQIIACAYWKRYPNPNSQHVFSEDMIDVQIDSKTGFLRSKRIIMKSNKLPWWGEHLFSARRVAVIEEAVIDPNGKVMTTYTRNIGLRFFMGTTEKVTYTSSEGEKNSDKQFITKECHDLDDISKESCQYSTKVKKEVWIESEVLGLRSAIRKFGMDRYKKNYIAAAQGFEWVLKNQFGHGMSQSSATTFNKIQTVSNCNLGKLGKEASPNIQINSYSNLGSSTETV